MLVLFMLLIQSTGKERSTVMFSFAKHLIPLYFRTSCRFHGAKVSNGFTVIVCCFKTYVITLTNTTGSFYFSANRERYWNCLIELVWISFSYILTYWRVGRTFQFIILTYWRVGRTFQLIILRTFSDSL